jgi:inorganic pyrophosphatase
MDALRPAICVGAIIIRVPMAKNKKPADPIRINPFDPEDGEVVNTIIETPMGSRNKFKYDPKVGCYRLSGLLPQGMVFPHAFGFIPRTQAADGDPEDVLVMMDEPTFAGCLVPAKLIGVIEALQTEDGKTERNDRLIAVAAKSHEHSELRSLKDLNPNFLKELEQFFVNYNTEHGKKFKVLGNKGPKQAWKLLKRSLL